MQTGGVTLTAQQPDNNVVRVALQALAAVLGGCQSLHTNARDEALALPTEESARLALRTQQLIAFESGVADSVDPLGGSYAVEAATDALEREALRLLERVEAAGGAVGRDRARAEMQARDPGGRLPPPAAGRARRARDRRRQPLSRERGGAARRDPAHRPRARARAGGARAGAAARGAPAEPWARALDVLEAAARSGANVVPAMVDAVLAWATVGEIAGRLRGVFGEHRETLVL